MLLTVSTLVEHSSYRGGVKMKTDAKETRSKIYIKPYIGSKYGKSTSIFKNKIMILGESHYGNHPQELGERTPSSEDENITNNVVNNYLNLDFKFSNWMNTLTKSTNSLYNKKLGRNRHDIKEINDIWSSLVFYNYVQVVLPASRIKPSQKAIDFSEKPFYEVLETTRPDILIVWGKRLWYALPHTNWTDGCDPKHKEKLSDYGFYTLFSGKRVFCIFTQHPSAAYNPCEYYDKIKEYLNGQLPNQ